MKSAGTNGTFNQIKDKERMFAVKKLFASIVVVLCITTFAGLSSAKNHPYGVDTMPTLSTSGSEYSEYIGVDAAKAIALRNVGLTESDVVFVKAKLDRDDGKMMYDIKFYSGNAEYEYEIDAHTGNIIKLNYDIEGYEISNVPAYNDGLYIGSDTARSIALSQVGLTLADVKYMTVKFDYDNGRAVYEVEFMSHDMEYEFDINAQNGKIVKYEVESIYD